MSDYPRLIIFLFSFFHCCCHLENDGDCESLEVLQILKDWVTFKKGSYWKYQEQSTQLEDSFWVFNQKNEFVLPVPDLYIQPCKEKILTFLTNQNTQDTGFIKGITFSSFANFIEG